MTLSASLANVFPASLRMNLLATTWAPGITSGANGASFLAVAATSRGRTFEMALMTAIGSRASFLFPLWVRTGNGERWGGGRLRVSTRNFRRENGQWKKLPHLSREGIRGGMTARREILAI